jgi:ankyrin repeat protein
MKIKVLLCMLLISAYAYAGVNDDFLKAVAAGNVKQAEKYLAGGADVNAAYTGTDGKAAEGETALIIASSAGNRAMVSMLLKKGADPNKSNEGYTAIIYATGKGFTEIVKMLIEGGANINQIHLDGTTPLINASINGNAVMVKLLIDKGADTAIKDYGKKTALDYAKNKEVKDLLEKAAKSAK